MLKKLAGALLLAALSANVSAQTEAAAAPTDEAAVEPAPLAPEQLPAEEYDSRWYISPSIGAISSDKSDLDNGPFGSLAIGKPIGNSLFGFEVEGTASKLDVNDLSSSEDYLRYTLGANGLFYLGHGGWQPYLSLGAYGHKIKFVEVDLPVGFGVNAGAGVAIDLGKRTALTLGLRYNLDFINSESDNVNNVPVYIEDDTFYVWTATVGLRFKLGDWPADSDGDGVPDHLDRCPNTPSGVQVDADGCPLDADGDGVPDYLDKCPGTPPGVQVDADGCPMDSDGDGVPDRLDKCPGTPAGVAVDRDGCPLDSDSDGVPDYLDKCPNTLKGLKIDQTGCPSKDQILVLDGVHFEFDKDRLTPDSRTILDNVVNTLKESPDLRFEIGGHTCNLGKAAYNERLSQRRAESVRSYLVSKGIPDSSLEARGYGFKQPRAPNDSEPNRELNRRVELRILE
jgi:outer membrane protein OmpA-like peptidoglycan-associated protein/opacity protein-like surface antigen